MKLQPLAEGVWLFPHDPDDRKVQPAVGVVSDGTQTVLIDAGNGITHAKAIQEALKAIKAPPVRHIIYTHHHWDHTYGACYFGAPVIAHVSCYEELRPTAKKSLDEENVDTQIRRSGNLQAALAANPDWRKFKVILPEVTFDTHMTVPLNGLTLLLDHVGGYHARDSIVVRVKEAKVMFLGDCFYASAEVKRANWHMLNGLLKDRKYHTFIPGHSAPIRRRNPLRFFAIRIGALVGALSQRA